VKSIHVCFSDEAVVRDEEETLRGKEAFEDWVVKTIEKYKFQFKPFGVDWMEKVSHEQYQGKK
jgi:hypothetical protein